MRAQITFPAVLIVSLSGSIASAVAQTGEFASPVPGYVVHDGWQVQDRLQNERSGMGVQPAHPGPRVNYYADPNSGKPVAASTTTSRNGTKTQQ
jgi:hypothetical protein